MRILIDGNPVANGNKTGIGYYTDQLIRELANFKPSSMSIDVYFYNLLGLQQKNVRDIENICPQKIIFPPAKIISISKHLGFLPPIEVFIRKRYDLAIFTNYVALPSLRKTPYALVVYDLSFLDHPDSLQPKNLAYLKHFCPPSIRGADLIITISEFTKSRLLHHFPELKAKIVVTPIPPLRKPSNTVDLSASLWEHAIKPSAYILYLGTIEPRKNVEQLVEAYVLLPDSIRDTYSLVLAGGKGWKDENIQKTIARRKLEGHNIITTGYISENEKAALYAHASCFVLPSHYEGFGMPIFEAMQYDTPVLLSDIPVFHEVAGSAAKYFDKDDATKIAGAILEVLKNDELRTEMISNAKARLKAYSWKENARLLHETFIQIRKG